MNTNSAYLTRAGMVSIELAKRLIPREAGDRLPTVADLAEELGTGVGTVQRALSILQQEDAIELDPRGKLGTFVAAINRPVLWQAAQQGLMVGLMPLPYTRRYEGLATGLRVAVERIGVPFSIAFMSGAQNRLDALVAGRDFAVVSRLAAQRAVRKRKSLEVCLDFGPETFVAGHAVVWASKRRTKHPRVGLDTHSLDQVELARMEFGDNATYVDVQYLQVLEHLRAREFDVTIWSRDALTDHDDLVISEFSTPGARDAAPLTTSAAILATRGSLVAGFLRSELDAELVIQTQSQVLKGSRVPSY
jgi:hypothetical protein